MDRKLKDLIKEKKYFPAENELHRIELVQKLLAENFPFENLDVLLEVDDPITPEFIERKMLKNGRGGLCYELNALQYLLLRELGFNVYLASATVASGEGWATDRTHVMNLLEWDEKLFVIDSGFGSNLPLQPVELDGPAVKSSVEDYRLRTCGTVKGSIVFQSRNEEGWQTRYAFFPEKVEWSDLNRIKREIHTSVNSAFNRELLIAQVVPGAIISLNEERLQIKKGEGENQRIHFLNEAEMLSHIKSHFREPVYKAAAEYVFMKKEGRKNV